MESFFKTNTELFKSFDKKMNAIKSAMLSNAHMLKSFEENKLVAAKKYKMKSIEEGCIKSIEICKEMIESASDLYYS